MKIENNGPKPLNGSEPEGARPLDRSQRGQEPAAGAGLGGKDRAVLSEQARLLAKAHAALDESAGVRQEKVEALRQRIQAGTYAIPFEELARRLAGRVRLE